MTTKKELENLVEWLEKLAENSRKEKIERGKTIKENVRHLLDKEVELGKKCPSELFAYVSFSHPLYVSMEFINRYKEWFDDLKKDG